MLCQQNEGVQVCLKCFHLFNLIFSHKKGKYICFEFKFLEITTVLYLIQFSILVSDFVIIICNLLPVPAFGWKMSAAMNFAGMVLCLHIHFAVQNHVSGSCSLQSSFFRWDYECFRFAIN